MTRYVKGKSFDQEIYVQGFYNQACVTLDASHEEPDGSDSERGFIGKWVPWDEYKSRWPESAKRSNLISRMRDDHFVQLGNEAPKWFSAKGETRLVYVVDCYYIERENRDLAQMPDGSVQWVDELGKGTSKPSDEFIRSVEDKQVKWAKIDGINSEPLEEGDWPGPDIPIVKVIGEQLQPYDNERRSPGLIRPARDSQQGRNAMGSKLVDIVALAPIPPIMMAAGADESFEK